jgi:hypothetical protein
MAYNDKLKKLVERQIDFGNVSVQFKVEYRDRRGKKTYIVTEDYQLERRGERKPFKVRINTFEEIKNQESLSEEDIRIFTNLFESLIKGQPDKISIGGLRLRNPILTASIGQSNNSKCFKTNFTERQD